MIFTETPLKDAYIIDIEKLEDERGFFARSWCRREFKAHGLNPQLVQCNISFNTLKGTMRGMHYQVKPFEEAKLVRCTMGSIYDVIVDIRPGSPSFKQYLGVILSAENRKMLYIPEGFAHGFLTSRIRPKSFTRCQSSMLRITQEVSGGMIRASELSGRQMFI